MSGQIDLQKDQYSDKLAKLLPAEGTAALLAINNIVPNKSTADPWILVAVIAIGLFVVLWARKYRQVADNKQLGFLILGFVVWAVNILSGRFTDYYYAWFGDYWFPFVPALIAILYSLFIPLVFEQQGAQAQQGAQEQRGGA
jgi:FtsH-binding integral membrane protein